eukprot:6208835-Pleurochrysis_carterae.AAC.3
MGSRSGAMNACAEAVAALRCPPVSQAPWPCDRPNTPCCALRSSGKGVRVARRLWVTCYQHGPSGSAEHLEAGDDVRPAALGELAPHLAHGAVSAVDAPSVLDLREGVRECALPAARVAHEGEDWGCDL